MMPYWQYNVQNGYGRKKPGFRDIRKGYTIGEKMAVIKEMVMRWAAIHGKPGISKTPQVLMLLIRFLISRKN